MTELPRKAHDLGGLPAGAVDREPHDVEWWEKRIDALLTLLADDQRQLICTDELRRAIEGLGPGIYEELSYYERWTLAIATVLLEKGVISTEELDARMQAVQEI